MDVFPTGLRGVDADLHFGGLPAGSVVGVEYPPASAGEAFLWTVVGRGFHPDGPLPVAPAETTFVWPDRVRYVTTGTPPATIAAALEDHAPSRTGRADRSLAFAHLDVVDGEQPSPAAVREIGADRPGIVVDAASDLCAFLPREAVGTYLSAVRTAVREQDGIALLAFTRGDRPWSPIERHVVQRCDGHVRFEPGTGAASAAVRFTRVRGAVGPVDGFPAVFDLDIARCVSVDTVERS